jgi:hypothetical protein
MSESRPRSDATPAASLAPAPAIAGWSRGTASIGRPATGRRGIDRPAIGRPATDRPNGRALDEVDRDDPVAQLAALASLSPSDPRLAALDEPHLLALTTRALIESERLRVERDTWMLIAEERELALQRAHDALDAVDGILAPAMDRPARRSSTAERRPLGRTERDRWHGRWAPAATKWGEQGARQPETD